MRSKPIVAVLTLVVFGNIFLLQFVSCGSNSNPASSSPSIPVACNIVTVSPVQGQAPLTVSFSANASGGVAPHSYSWSFGDGSSSTIQSPSHTYTSTGHFSVTVTATDSKNQQVTADTVVDVTTSAQAADLVVHPGVPALENSQAQAGGQIVLKAGSVKNEGQTAAIQSALGIYFSLDSTITKSDTKLGTISVSALPVNASFSWTDQLLNIPLGMAPGTYYVGIWADENGVVPELNEANNVVAVRLTITSGAAPTCAATGIPTTGEKPLTVAFSGSATGGHAPYSYSWNFGDGATSSVQNISHTYTNSGSFNAILTVTDANSATCKDTVPISVTQPAQGPVLSGPTSSTGIFTLGWTFGWPVLASSNDKVSVEQKIGSGSYAEISQVMRSNGSSLQLTRTAGTYSYRVRAYFQAAGVPQWSAYSNEVTVQVTAPPSKTRFTNNSTYFIVSLTIDGVEQFLASPNGLLPGYYYEKDLAPGNHSYVALYGFWNEYGGRENLYQSSGNYTQRAGTTEQIGFTSPTVFQLLTKFQTSGTWSAYVPGYVNKVKFRFFTNGTFSFTNLQGQTTSGNYSFVSRNGTAWTVTFSAGGYQGTIYEFYDYFVMYNGPGNAALQYFYDGM